MAKRNFIPLVPSGTINADASVAQLEQDVLAMDAKVGELAEDIGDTEQEIVQLKSQIDDLNPHAPIIEKGTGLDSARGVTADPNEGNVASGDGSFAFGYHNNATGTASFSVGGKNSNKPDNTASGYGSVVIGVSSVASNTSAVAIGGENTASGKYSFALGFRTTASGQVSLTAGQQAQATGTMATAIGNYTIASGRAALAIGQANIEDTNPVDSTHGSGARKYLFTIGNGLNTDNRSNAMTVDWSGNEELAGSITLGKSTEDEVTLTAAQLKALLALLN